MESKEILFKKYVGLTKKLFREEFFIRPEFVHVNLRDIPVDHPYEFFIEVKLSSNFLLFPADLNKVVGMSIVTLGLSEDKKFYTLLYHCK